MQDLNAWMFFAAVVEHGGFTAASRKLGVPKSRISRHISMLERRLGVRLLQRSTRQLSLTDIGHKVLHHSKVMLQEAQAATAAAAAMQVEPSGQVHLSCPLTLLQQSVSPLLSQFLKIYPKVHLHVTASNRAMDVLAEGVDIALRVHPLPLHDSDLALRILGYSRQILLASPACIALQGGMPGHPQDLKAWPSLGQGQPQDKHLWKFTPAPSTSVADPTTSFVLQHHPRLTCNDMGLLREAARQGLGAVRLPPQLVQQDLETGSLLQLLPEWCLPEETVHAVFPSRRGMVSAVRALLDFMAASFTHPPLHPDAFPQGKKKPPTTKT